MGLKKIGKGVISSAIAAIAFPLLNGSNLFSGSLSFALWGSPVFAQTMDPRQAAADQWLDQGLAQFQQSDFQAALASWQQALNLYREIGDRTGEGSALSNLGATYRRLGEYATAIEYLQQSLAIAREIGNLSSEARALGNLGNAYNSLGNYTSALEYHQQLLAIARSLGDRTLEGIALSNLGNVLQNLGDYETAIAYHQQFLVIARSLGDRAVEGAALSNLGIAYFALGDNFKAIEFHEQGLAIAREMGDRFGEAIALGNLGKAYFAVGDYLKAIEYQQQDLAIVREIGDRDGEGNALNNLGLSFFYASQLREAETALTQGIAVWETIREQLGNQDAWKISIFEEQARTYRLLQQVLIAQNRPEDALEISERGRARAFVELIAQKLASDSEIAAKINFPNLEQIKQVAQQQNAVLVEYSLIFDQFLYIWVIQPTGEIIFRSVDLTQQEATLNEVAQAGHVSAATGRLRGTESEETLFTEMVRGTRDALGNGTDTTDTTTPQPRINRRLQQLHQLLIEPIADLLPTDPNQHVIFIPQGSLFLIPFAALQDETGDYLIEKHTILTAPAIQVLELTQQQQTNTSGELLIVGNPTMPKVLLAQDQPAQQLRSLPGSEAEAVAIASLLNADVLSGDRATETLVKQKMPQASVIHLATHGLLEDFTGNGIPGAIALTPSGTDDGLLTSDELLALNLKADLVVLSACDTGRGEITGDGVVGLSRSILTAGAASAIVSLWQVPDQITANLMVEFYRQWQQSGDKAQALRQAMLKTLEQSPHPMNWAAFTIMGES